MTGQTSQFTSSPGHASYLLLNIKIMTFWWLNLSYALDADLLELAESKGKYAKLLSDMCKFYRDWHVKSDGVYGNLQFISLTNL